jgi:hypothetical protein
MNRVRSVMAGSLLAVLIAGAAFNAKLVAQNGPGEIFTVPFAFTADGHQIQPGTYEIRRDSTQFLMSIQNVKTGDKQLFSVRPEQRAGVSAKGLLVFHGCSDRKQLSEFHVRGTSLFSATMDSQTSSNLHRESCSRQEVVTLAAR